MNQQQFFPAEPDRTASEETIISTTGFAFWWGGAKYNVLPNAPATLTRAQLDALEKPGKNGSLVAPLFERVKFVHEQAIHHPVWQTPSTAWVAPGADVKPEPTPLPAELSPQVAIIADEYVAFSHHGQTLQVRPRERTILERDQVLHLASLGFPFKVVD